jgi:hypothetical protein
MTALRVAVVGAGFMIGVHIPRRPCHRRTPGRNRLCRDGRPHC